MTDIEGEVEETVICCQGCGGIEDHNIEGQQWIACDDCNVWMHSVCVGRWSQQQCDQAFLCRSCSKLTHDSRTRRSIRHSSFGRKKIRRPCTPLCKPPGCVQGSGCEKGMIGLSLFDQAKIQQLVLDLEKANMRFIEGPGQPGEQIVFEPDTGLPIQGTVLSWESPEAVIQYHVGGGDLVEQRIPLTRVIRFRLRLTEEELEQLAKDYGCTRFTPHSKQLRYEMRKVRKIFNLTLPLTPAAYIKMKQEERDIAGRGDGSSQDST